jgi:hypothetical protein
MLSYWSTGAISEDVSTIDAASELWTLLAYSCSLRCSNSKVDS